MATPTDSPKFSSILRGGKSLSQTVHELVTLDRSEDLERVQSRNWKHIQNLSTGIYPLIRAAEPLVHVTEKRHHARRNVSEKYTEGGHGDSGNQKNTGDVDIDQIRQKLEKYEENLGNMTMEITKLREINETQRKSFEDLNKVVQKRHLSTEEVLLQTQRALQEQTNLLTKQDYILQKLLEERRRHDRLMDLGFLLFSLYLARSPVVKYTVLLLYGHLVTNRRPHKWLFQYLRIFLVFNVCFFAKLANDKMEISKRILQAVLVLSKITSLRLGNFSAGRMPAILGRKAASLKPPSLY